MDDKKRVHVTVNDHYERNERWDRIISTLDMQAIVNKYFYASIYKLEF